MHDFADKELGKAAPYGVFDVANTVGWVNVGISHDTAAFAVESIRRWWKNLGQARFPTARRLLITADCGGSNGSRVRLWKVELQKLATELGPEISVCHLPPGTSKWNKIEHRLLCRQPDCAAFAVRGIESPDFFSGNVGIITAISESPAGYCPA